ncbi:putative transporter [Ilyonectria robusta]
MADKGEIPQPELPTVASSPVTSVRENDENEVWWDGPDDLENPLNWTSAQRWASIWMVSFMTFLTAFASSMFAPGVPQMAAEFGSTNPSLLSFVVSVYVLGFAFGPLDFRSSDRSTGKRFFDASNRLEMEFLGSWHSGASSTAALIFMTETHAPTILKRKTIRLQKSTGNSRLRSKLQSNQTFKELFISSLARPTEVLFLSPICALISLYMAVVYGYLYLILATYSTVYRQQYGFSDSMVGLSFLGLGIGSILTQAYTTIVGERIYLKHLKAGDNTPEHRLTMMIHGAIVLPIGLFWYGWSAYARAHWIVPILGSSLVGAGIVLVMMPSTSYLIDCFQRYAASAIAASTVVRCLFGAVLPLAGTRMFNALGLGWGNSLLAFIALVLMPIPFLFIRYGGRLRERFKYVESSEKDKLTVINPRNGEVVTADVHVAGHNEVKAAVSAATAAFEQGPWSKTKGVDRSRLLHKLADLLEQNSSTLAELESIAMGNPAGAIQYMDIPTAVDVFRCMSKRTGSHV